MGCGKAAPVGEPGSGVSAVLLMPQLTLVRFCELESLDGQGLDMLRLPSTLTSSTC